MHAVRITPEQKHGLGLELFVNSFLGLSQKCVDVSPKIGVFISVPQISRNGEGGHPLPSEGQKFPVFDPQSWLQGYSV